MINLAQVREQTEHGTFVYMYAAPFKGIRELLKDRHQPNFKLIRLAVVGLGIHNEYVTALR